MNYEDMSDFEVSKKVAFAIRGRDAVCVIDTSLGKLVRIFNGNPECEEGSGWVDFDPCNNPSDAWPLLLKLTESGCTIVIEKESVNGKLLNGKSITRKIAELYISFNSD